MHLSDLRQASSQATLRPPDPGKPSDEVADFFFFFKSPILCIFSAERLTVTLRLRVVGLSGASADGRKWEKPGIVGDQLWRLDRLGE